MSINDLGESAGSSGGEAAFWDAQGHDHLLGTLPGFRFSAARGMNNKGQVVGYAYNSDSAGLLLTNPAHAFLWEKGHMRDLGVPAGCICSRAYSINDAGQVAGWVLTDGGKTHAMVWENGVVHDIGAYPGVESHGDISGDVSVATAINNAGQVVGSAQLPDKTVSAFLWQNGVMHYLGVLPGDTHSKAFGINDLGQITGVSTSVPDYFNGFPSVRMFIWDAKHGMRDLAALSSMDAQTTHGLDDHTAHNQLAFSINRSDQIAGITYYTRPSVRKVPCFISPEGRQ